MHHRIVLLVCFWSCLGELVAQDFAAGLDAAQAKIDAKEWRQAVDLLLALRDKVEIDEDREVLAVRLLETSERLVAVADFEAGVRACAGALFVQRSLYGDSDRAEVATARNRMALCLYSLGRPSEALPHFEHAFAMRERLYGDSDHPEVASSAGNVAACLQSLGRAAEALPLHERASAIRTRLCGDADDSDLAASLVQMADCLQVLGRAGEALTLHERALEMRRRLCSGADHPSVATSLNNVAISLESLGRVEAALGRFEQALAMNRRLYGDRDHPDVATNLTNLAGCLDSLGRAGDALPRHVQALEMNRRVHGDRDHPNVAASLNNVGACLGSLDRAQEALPLLVEALAMNRRLCGDRDHPAVAKGLSGVANCLLSLDRAGEALPQLEQALAMQKRLYGDGDNREVARGTTNLARCLQSLGRSAEALPLFEQASAMRRRSSGDRDDHEVATSSSHLALCLQSLGRPAEALPWFASALAMHRRLCGDRDDLEVAICLNNVAACRQTLGRMAEALLDLEQALAMRRRLYGDRDHSNVATSLHNVAACLEALGRAGDALPLFEQAQAMWKRLHGDRDHEHLAASLNGIAFCMTTLGRFDEALPQYEAALAMWQRLYGDRDHPDVAKGLNNVALCLQSAGRPAEALPRFERALAMSKRLRGDRDHADVAQGLNNVAHCMQTLGRAREALPNHELVLAMHERLYGDRDHRDVVAALVNTASCFEALGRAGDALPRYESALAMIERMRDAALLSPVLRQSLFEAMKSPGVFERFQQLAGRLGRAADAMHAAERGRGRGLLDQLEQFADPEVEAERRARQRGDESSGRRVAAMRKEVEEAHAEGDRLLHELTRLAEQADVPDREARRAALLARSDANSTRLRQLLDERARLLGGVLPVGRVRTPAEIQGVLRSDELLLEFTVTRDVALLYVLAREGAVDVIDLPNAFATSQRLLPALLQRSSHEQLRGRDAEPGSAPAGEANTELFASLIPPAVWDRVRKSRRVFVAAHRDLHRVPFEMLVTSSKDGKPSYWLDEGPPISYVPSGTMLHWLRERAKEGADDATSLDLLAIGDPSALDAEPPIPEQGVFVLEVNDGGEGARIGLRPGDVLTSYDTQPLVDDRALRDVRMETEKAIEDEKRGDAPIPIGVWRRGNALTLDARPGPLGIEVGPGKARAAFEASLDSEARLERITRAGDLERLRSLPPLVGAREETEAIEKVFAGRKAKTKRLLGAEATEPAVFDLAAKAKYLHFACHGIAEEYAGQSLSMLVLSQPRDVLPGDDGLLKLADLWHTWRGRLSSCRLVVLSACRTNVATTQRDEAPQALPLGFFYAGVPSVISSLWAVDDRSTRDLMTDYYGRLLAGETDKLKAFADAKKALRAKFPDPFHWAPFLFLGAPE